MFAEVTLPDPEDGKGFGIHPALFDAALHAGIVHGLRGGVEGFPALPFTWNRVVLHAAAGKARSVHPLLWVVAGLFVAYFAVDPITELLT